MTAPLTALERDLLACVELLVTACEVSAKELSGLEERSTTKMQSQMDGLAACVSVLIPQNLLGSIARMLRRGLQPFVDAVNSQIPQKHIRWVAGACCM